ncbi:MAG: ferritin [Candidatus Krumholzibacteria bacterium]|nr:ferritin [Candidatus Krumholzibacteria bacterium]
MLSKKMETAINQQINQEIYSAHMYLAMSAYFSERNLNGFAHWMRIQYHEELTHAERLVDYLLERNGNVALGAIQKPTAMWKTTLAACQAAYKAEVKNTEQINSLMDQAIKEHDHATRVILQWFVEEQVEEEAQALNVVEQVKMAQDSAALFILDRELGARTPEAGA